VVLPAFSADCGVLSPAAPAPPTRGSGADILDMGYLILNPKLDLVKGF